MEEDTGAINLRWAHALMDGLAAAGIDRVVLSPGARSTPLVLACERHPNIHIRVLLDERSAAFFALGLSRFDGRPTALIATSGSAPAHWLPAVIEASHGGVPLILLSADRPPELHDWGSNQTTDQSRLFDRHIRAFHDPGAARPGAAAINQLRALGIKAASQSLWPRPGPVHINLPFREPLIPASEPDLPPPAAAAAISRPLLQPDPDQIKRLSRLLAGGHGMIVCGPGDFSTDTGRLLLQLAERTGAPLFADPLSGLRFGHHHQQRIITRYDAFLRAPAETLPQPDWILRFGPAPVSKWLLQFLARSNCIQILCEPTGTWPDPDQRCQEVVRCAPASLCHALLADLPQSSHSWLSAFQRLEQLASNMEAPPPAEKTIIEQMLSALPDNSLLFSSNSMPIRQLDSWSGSGGKSIRILANRGISGIDGNISTLLGLAAAAPERRVVGLVGDLACLHDSNGLLAANGLNATIVLLNNGGGGIFGYLPQAQLSNFGPHWLTPHTTDFSLLAQLHGIGHRRIEQTDDFAGAFRQTLELPGVQLIEVVIDREESIRRHQAGWEAVAKKVIDGG